MNRTTSISTVRTEGRTNVNAGSGASHQQGASRGRSAARLTTAAVLGLAALAAASAAIADDSLPSVSVGAGMRTSFESTKPDGGNTDNNFDLNSIRLYV